MATMNCAAHAALEEKFPGFRACFGGEELRRAQAAMSGKLVGGTIEALLATDMPPSLAHLSSHSRQPPATRTPIPSQPSSPSASPTHGLTHMSATLDGGHVASSDLDHLAHMYHMELERLGALSAQPQGGDTSPLHPSTSIAAAAAVETVDSVGVQGDVGHASACYEAAYSCGLVLQDLAARCAPGSQQHLARLQEACEKYRLAVRHRPGAHSTLYNWGVALSDLARATRPTDPATAKVCLEAASQRYAQALASHPDTPQALNNWGLVLQELSGLARGRKERDALLRQACTKFRQAVRLRPEFDRGVYNLGTVCYAAACMMQGELAAQLSGNNAGGPTTSPPKHHHHQHHQQHRSGGGAESGSEGGAGGHQSGGAQAEGALAAAAAAQQAAAAAAAAVAAHRAAKEAEVHNLFTSAAQYIVLAYALQQRKDIYRKSLGVVKKLLPLPFLRAGYLTAVIPNTQGTPEEAWRQDWFILDATSLRSATEVESSLSAASLTSPSHLTPHASVPHSSALPLMSISHVARVRDPTLPKGEAFVVVMHGTQLGSGQEVVFVAEDEDTADGWQDVITLAAHCAQSRSPEALAEALMPAVGHGMAGAGGGGTGVSGVGPLTAHLSQVHAPPTPAHLPAQHRVGS